MAIDLSGWEKVINQIAKDLHEGKIKPTDLNKESISKTFNTLNEGAADGYGKGWGQVSKMPSRDAILLQRNLYKFSGAKTFTMLEELNSKMVKDGKIVPFSDFKKEALKLNNQYNLNHLQAEYQTANHSAKMAVNWETYQRDKARFPNLKFKTQEDTRVSEEHKKLKDIIAPIDGTFWKNHYPPLRFRCRCYTVQTSAEASENIPKVEVPPEFQNNVAITKEIFSESKHPFFQLAKRGVQGRQDLRQALEGSKENAPKYTHTTPKGRKVAVSMFADLKDLASNLKTASTATDALGIKAEINAHKSVGKNPELKFDDKIGDKVAPVTKNIKRGISNAFDDKLKKGGQLRNIEDTFISVDLDGYTQTEISANLIDIAKQTNAKIKTFKNVSSCFLEFNGVMVIINKEDSFEMMLKKLNDLI